MLQNAILLAAFLAPCWLSDFSDRKELPVPLFPLYKTVASPACPLLHPLSLQMFTEHPLCVRLWRPQSSQGANGRAVSWTRGAASPGRGLGGRCRRARFRLCPMRRGLLRLEAQQGLFISGPMSKAALGAGTAHRHTSSPGGWDLCHLGCPCP